MREFAVIAHGIQVNQIQGQPDERIEQIYKQNPKIRGLVEILRVAFTKKLLRSGRTTGPLIISVAEPEQANRLIDASLIWHHELHDCEPFNRNCVITQCFKCYQYRHVAHNCHNIQRYGVCAAPGDATNDCLGKEDRMKHRCVNCHGKHQSWARECPERTKQAAAAKEAYNTRPVRFQTELPTQACTEPLVERPGEPATATATATAPAQTTTTVPNNCSHQPPTVEVDEQWTQVGTRSTISPPAGLPEKIKRGPGRPKGSTKASKGTKGKDASQ